MVSELEKLLIPSKLDVLMLSQIIMNDPMKVKLLFNLEEMGEITSSCSMNILKITYGLIFREILFGKCDNLKIYWILSFKLPFV